MAIVENGASSIALITKFTAFRWVVVLVVLVTLGLDGVVLTSMQRTLDEMSETKRGGPLWIATQMEFEFMRFEKALALFAHDAPDVTADDVRFRFDILWSRVDIAAAGQAGQPAAAGSDAANIISALAEELRRQDPVVLAFKGGETEAAKAMLETFGSYREGLHDYTLAAKHEQSDQDTFARTHLWLISKLIAFLSAAIGVVSLFVAALFFADSRHYRKMSAENAELLAEAQLAYKAKSQFLSTVSHELRTPLTSIKGTLGLMKGGALGPLPDKFQRIVDIAYENSNRLALLINDILDLEKSESGSLSYQFRDLDLSALVEDAVEANRNYDPARNIAVTISGTETPVTVHGDDDRLMQVMLNLLSNAVKFSYPNGQVHVTLARTGRKVRVSVQDHGYGIAEGFRDKVFEKFTQADASDTRQSGGTGLGMNIARTIIENHGGTIGFVSEVGRGTTFFFELPTV
ncbi:sensor histidine kinase [Actibacterium sp. D379-3]